MVLFMEVSRMTTDFNLTHLEWSENVANGPSYSALIDCMRLRITGVQEGAARFILASGKEIFPTINGICISEYPTTSMILRIVHRREHCLISYNAFSRGGVFGKIRSDYKPPAISPGTTTLLSVPNREELFDALEFRRKVDTVRFMPETLNGHHERMSVTEVHCLHPGYGGAWLYRGELASIKQWAWVWCFCNHGAGVMKILDED